MTRIKIVTCLSLGGMLLIWPSWNIVLISCEWASDKWNLVAPRLTDIQPDSQPTLHWPFFTLGIVILFPCTNTQTLNDCCEHSFKWYILNYTNIFINNSLYNLYRYLILLVVEELNRPKTNN